MKKSLFILGGELSQYLLKSGYTESCFDINGKILGQSPFSLGEKVGIDEIPDSFPINIQIDLKKNLETVISKRKSDYILIDTSCFCRTLIKINDVFYTKPLASYEKWYSQYSYNEIVPLKTNHSVFENVFAEFIKIITKYYKSEEIILIRSYKSDYYAVAGYLRGYYASGYNEWVNYWENIFIEKTDCHHIDITKFYFSEKYPEKHLSEFSYENLCFKEISAYLKDISDNKPVPEVWKPDIIYSIQRYSRFYNNLDKKPFRVFLDLKNPMQLIMLNMSADTVSEYSDIWLKLENRNAENVYDVYNMIVSEFPYAKKLHGIVQAVICMIAKDWQNDEADYITVFEKEMPAVQHIIPKIQNVCCTLYKNFREKKITEHNIGYYFYLMRICSGKKEMPSLLKFQNNTVKNPVVFDIWGSCISRVTCNTWSSDFVVGKYLFQCSFLSPSGSAMDYDKKLLPETPDWKDKLLVLQMNGEINQTINENSGEWLLVDLFSITASCNYTDGNGWFVTDTKNELAVKLGLKHKNIWRDIPVNQTYEYIKSVCSLIKSKYKDRIILITNWLPEHYVNQSGKICPFPQRKENREKNIYSKKCTEYFASCCDCYHIDITAQFLADECSLLELSPAHYEKAFYEETGRIIKYISENKPKQKRFNQYSTSTRINRMIRFMEKNKGSNVLEELFTDENCDLECINSDINILKANKEKIIELYEKADYEKIKNILNQNFAEVIE